MVYKVGIVGYGYWGPNIARNFANNSSTEVIKICDKDSRVKDRIYKSFKDVSIVSDYKDVTRCGSIDIVAVVTPTVTHHQVTKDALLNNKHVLVTKPFTYTSDEAKELIDIANDKNLTISVDHTFLFTSSVQKIKNLIDSNELGNLYYYDSRRINLGLFQHDVNVIWDLAPHDFSIIDYIIEEKPIQLSAHGIDNLNRGLENVAYITLYFQSNIIAHINLNWLSPVKVRTTLIGGDKKMLVYNDIEPDEKIKIYKKGISMKDKEDIRKMLIEYRSGDAYIPKLENKEALELEIEHFIDTIEKRTEPINSPQSGLNVVKMLEASNRSLKENGKVIQI